jgi:hypothetical protein
VSSSLVHVTVPPGGTVTGEGLKANWRMVTAPGDGTSLGFALAAGAAAALGIEVLVEEAFGSPSSPQPLNASRSDRPTTAIPMLRPPQW